ncbi:MAG: hypothetical protein E7565_02175 [Ruminococcaceae bacterium]|nr:hypothetical protein [Oscillospiraceae bacterium]
MKKIVSVVLCMLMLFSAFAFSSSADQTVGVLKAGRVTAEMGEEITIPITLEDHKGVCIIRVTVKYDAKVLEYKGYIESASKDFGYTVGNSSEGEVVVLMDGKQLCNIDGDITLVELKFKVKNNAPSGRTLVRVFCEEGMATYLATEGNKITPTAFIPATSTGSVTVLCAEHDFVSNTADGSLQCSKCGAIKTVDGSVSVDSSQGLPEIDISSEVASVPDENNSTDDSSLNDENNTDKGNIGIKFVYFIPLIAAVVIIGVVLLLKLKKSDKNQNL